MNPDGVLSEHQKQIRFRKLIQKRRIQGEPIPKSYLRNKEEDDWKAKPESADQIRKGSFFSLRGQSNNTYNNIPWPCDILLFHITVFKTY